MVDIERGQSDLDPYSPSMGEFGGKIRNCHDASMARSRVQSVLANYNQMRLAMPKTIQLKVARFLRHEKWVDSPRNLSQSHQYKMLIGQGRSKVLNFSAWLVVAAIWPSHLRVLGIADEMSRFWGQSFPDTRPFFPTNVSEEEALIKYDGNFVQGDEYPLSDAGDSFNRATKSTRLTELPLCPTMPSQSRSMCKRPQVLRAWNKAELLISEGKSWHGTNLSAKKTRPSNNETRKSRSWSVDVIEGSKKETKTSESSS